MPGEGLVFQMNFSHFLNKVVQDTYRRDVTGLY